MSHHPSCKPNDRSLVWHCCQCGENEFPESVLEELTEAKRQLAAIREAAQAVVDRWETPLWKEAEPTAAVINRLRKALAATPPHDTAPPAT